MLIKAGLLEDGCDVDWLYLSGRTDVADFFEQSGIRSYAVLNHTPILAFVYSSLCGPEERDDGLQVRIIAKPVDLLSLDDAVKCMAQWQGKHRSDFFQFTVGQFRAHLAEHTKKSGQRI